MGPGWFPQSRFLGSNGWSLDRWRRGSTAHVKHTPPRNEIMNLLAKWNQLKTGADVFASCPQAQKRYVQNASMFFFHRRLRIRSVVSLARVPYSTELHAHFSTGRMITRHHWSSVYKQRYDRAVPKPA